MLSRNTTIFTNMIRELGLKNDEIEIKTKASELQKEVDRKIDAKLMAHWASCKPTLCIHIACEMLGIPFNKNSIVKLASTTDQNYYSSLSYIKKILNITTINFELLVTRFGCPKILPYLESMFEIFKNNWSKKLTNANIVAIDWDDETFKVAIFWCVCKVLGGKSQISQQDLIDLPEVTITRVELNKYTKLVETHCKSYVTELKSRKKELRISLKKPILKKRSKKSRELKNNDDVDEKRGRKRKLEDEEEESNNKKRKENDETRMENNSKSIDKGKDRMIEEKSCIGPLSSNGEMKIVNFWETDLYRDYRDWRKRIVQKIENY